MTAPSRIAYPLRTKVIIAAVLVASFAGIAIAGLRTQTGGEEDAPTLSGVTGDEVSNEIEGVEALFPGRGDESVLGQTPFGIDLAPGWTGEIQLVLGSGTVVELPEDEVTVVPELGRISYQPLPGKTVERLDGGTNCVQATIYDRVRGRAASERLVEWCFRVL